MDPLTHALAAYTLKRAAFPRLSRAATIAIVLAGTVADIDFLSSYFGPSAYLTFYRTYFHSVLAAVIIAALAALPFLFRKHEPPNETFSPRIIFFAALAAALLHLLLDLCQTSGVEQFWPFSSRRFALDYLAHFDLWIFTFLLAGLLLPQLSRLVSEEIASKSKKPGGRVGATLTLAALVLYVLLRMTMHGNAIAALESRSYRGESPRRVAAFAESSSPFLWSGIVETERALHTVDINVGPGANFDPESAINIYKPEPSVALDAARDSAVGRRFLQSARFPKASVERIPAGFRVTLQSFPYARDARSTPQVQALIDTSPSGQILSQHLTWDDLSRQSALE
jgi:inner membrane protein